MMEVFYFLSFKYIVNSEMAFKPTPLLVINVNIYTGLIGALAGVTALPKVIVSIKFLRAKEPFTRNNEVS